MKEYELKNLTRCNPPCYMLEGEGWSFECFKDKIIICIKNESDDLFAEDKLIELKIDDVKELIKMGESI